MRAQLREIEEIDRYIRKELAVQDRLVFQARLIVDAGLREKVRLQRRAHQLVRWFSREERRGELELVHLRLMEDEEFGAAVRGIFR